MECGDKVKSEKKSNFYSLAVFKDMLRGQGAY